ncbi:hypothetical protein [Bacillus cereus]|uniref:hypothetical protein n=1 Tax=Bacillus cereus TaxID=1396 RepID=UPI00159BB82C|nr:hypothetical protein [Bacillus cereus]
MKKYFSSGKSKRNHYNWFRGDDKCNPSKVTKYTLSEEELSQLKANPKSDFNNKQ